jgi:uncharacterized protein
MSPLPLPTNSNLITSGLIALLRQEFRLEWQGLHGAPHWARVRHNGLELAHLTGANTKVIEYFAFLHDVCRESDGHDSGHGARAARFALTVREGHIDLDEEEFALLIAAIEGHTVGRRHGEVTVSTCWDADRLDLARVGVTPDPGRLCTAAARDREMILRASKNATDWVERYYDRLPSPWSDQP